MKKKLTTNTIFILGIIIYYLLIINRSNLISTTTSVINTWITIIVPSLFPTIIVNYLLISFNVYTILDNKLTMLINKIFNLNGPSLYVFIMSYFSGTPSNVILIKELYQNQIIDKPTADKYLILFFYNNPIFLYNILTPIFSNHYFIYILLFIPIVITIILALIIKIPVNNKMSKTIFNPKLNFSIITNTFMIMLNILAIMLFLAYISCLISNTFATSNPLIYGLLEITNGLLKLVNTNNFSLAFIILIFGGLSIHLQIKSIIADTNLSCQKLIICRYILTVIAIAIAQIIFAFN